MYKGTLLDGRVVAVKVQRPSVLAEIALDLFVLRLLTPLQVRVSNLINKRTTEPSDIAVASTLVVEWGRGFVAEVCACVRGWSLFVLCRSVFCGVREP